MNTTPIFTAAALLAASVPAFSQGDPFGDPGEPVPPPPPAESATADPFAGPNDPFSLGPRKPHDEALTKQVDVEFPELPLPSAIKYLQQLSGKPLNFVVRPPADQVVVPPMQVRGVSIYTVLEVIENLTPIRVTTIRGNDHGAPVIVIHAMEPMRSQNRSAGTTAHPLAPDSRQLRLQLPENLSPSNLPMVAPVINPRSEPEPFTRAYPVREILNFVELEALLNLINEFWSRSDPDWAKKSAEDAIALHEATGMLIVKAPLPRQEELQSLLKGLESSDKSAQPDPELLKMKARLVEFEHRAELTMRTAEEQRAKSNEAEFMLRDVISQRDKEVIELQRTITELKDSLERAKAAQ